MLDPEPCLLDKLVDEVLAVWSWRVQSAVSVALIIAFRLLGYSDGWYALVVPHLVGTFFGWQLKATVKNHLSLRTASVALHAVGVLIVLGVLSPWFIIALVIGWAFVGTAAADGQGTGK